MKVTTETMLAAAERVVRARDELAAAEKAFAELAGTDSKTTSRKMTRGAARDADTSTVTANAEPVTQRVRRFLARGGRHTFQEITEAVQPATVTAVRSALSLDREKGTVEYDGETWAVVAPKAQTKRPPVAGSKKEPATGG